MPPVFLQSSSVIQLMCKKKKKKHARQPGIFIPFLFFVFIASFTQKTLAAPSVVVSISPLHSLVGAVMEGVAEPELLIEGGQSPHTQSLKPSSVRALRDADLVVWVGPGLETAMRRSVQRIQEAHRVFTLSNSARLRLLESRQGGIWGKHDHEDHGDEEHGDEEHGDEEHGDEEHGESRGHASEHHLDPHVWLSTDNAGAIVRAVSERLQQIDPQNKDRYAKNATSAIDRIDRLQRRIEAQLMPVRNKSYVVFHDAYQYFEEQFGLRPAGSVTISPDRLIGAKRVQELGERIRSENIVCIFSEPQFEPRLLQILAENSTMRLAELDPLGARIYPGVDAWFVLMQNLADSLADCLR